MLQVTLHYSVPIVLELTPLSKDMLPHLILTTLVSIICILVGKLYLNMVSVFRRSFVIRLRFVINNALSVILLSSPPSTGCMIAKRQVVPAPCYSPSPVRLVGSPFRPRSMSPGRLKTPLYTRPDGAPG